MSIQRRLIWTLCWTWLLKNPSLNSIVQNPSSHIEHLNAEVQLASILPLKSKTVHGHLPTLLPSVLRALSLSPRTHISPLMLRSHANMTLSLNFLRPPILRRRLNNMMQQPVSKIRTNNKKEYHGDGDFVEHGWSAVVL
jgi:hypothetical protein